MEGQEKEREENRKSTIPDDEVIRWMRTLVEDEDNPLSVEEAEQMMSELNFEFGRRKMSPETKRVLDAYIQKYSKHENLTHADKQRVREMVLRLEKITKDLKRKNSG